MKQPDMPPSPDEPALDRGEIARQKLVAAAIEVFGLYGYDGTKTRELATRAGVNQQAIPYYFGGKQGLYLAAADHIAAAIAGRVGGRRQAVQERIAEARDGAGPLGAGEARQLLTTILEPLADLLVSEESASWARFLIREQMAPTEAFARIYARVMGPLLETARTLVAIALDERPSSERVRLRTASLMGGILVFRVANAAAMKFLEWKSIGSQERAIIRAHVADLVASLDGARS